MQQKFRYVGPPEATPSGREVLAFHLHRYLAHWLAKHDCDTVWVTVGFETGSVGSLTVEVGRHESRVADVGWTYAQLLDAHHAGEGVKLAPAEGEEPRAFDAVPLADGTQSVDRSVLGFAVTRDAAVGPEGLAELEVHAGEAVRAARRNGVRMFFDEQSEEDVKVLLYGMLEHLPEWVGCDVAAAVVASDSLEAMNLSAAHEADFRVMAERLYVGESTEDAPRYVGMVVDTRDAVTTVIDAAIQELQESPGTRVLVFRRDGDEYVSGAGTRCASIGRMEGRPTDRFSVVVPLVAGEERDPELMGFVCLAYSGAPAIPDSVYGTLTALSRRLAQVLRYSPLYTLNARIMLLLRRVRQACEAAVEGSAEREQRLDAMIEDVVELVHDHTDVPAFSVGYLTGEPGARKLRFVDSFGWSEFEAIELDVDVDESRRADTGVAALSVRLNRALVLAGGRLEGDHREFRNFLMVHEATGRVVDLRAPEGGLADGPGWTPLSEYYVTARRSAYATVAQPISFGSKPLGVIALEVDRETNWNWWTGHSGQLIWELLASELAFALRDLGVQA